MNWYLKVLKNYLGFSGRARRKEYWMFVLFNIIFGLIAQLLDNALGITFNFDFNYSNPIALKYGYIYTFYSLVVFLPSIAVLVRRLHDVGKSGWLLVKIFALFFGIIIFTAILTTAIGPAAGIIMVLVMLGVLGVGIWVLVLLCTDSEPGENKYGPNPKDPSQSGFTKGEALDSGINV